VASTDSQAWTFVMLDAEHDAVLPAYVLVENIGQTCHRRREVRDLPRPAVPSRPRVCSSWSTKLVIRHSIRA
jgi:hypothetical protein